MGLCPRSALVLLLVLGFGCGRPSPPAGETAESGEAADPVAAPVFVDVAAELGIDTPLASGRDATYPMPAVMGGGVAVFDADGDGDLDLYFTSPAPGGNRFYWQGVDGRFADATVASGLAGDGMGLAVGDLDNDGDLDLYLARVGPDRLLLNDGSGVFVDRTGAWGAATPGWSSSVALLDFDRDGFLDLYVARYVAFDPQRVCSQHGGRRDFCGPTEFAGLSDVLLRNAGGERFEDVSAHVGITAVRDAGLGVVAADFDHDGRVDIYVANDADPNNLWVQEGDGRFVDDAVLQGSAFNRWGNSEAGMGIAVGDADRDLDLDLFVTHLITETNTYYRNLMLPGFEDGTIDAELGAASQDLTGFGAAFFDADNDGDLDLAVANGAVKRRPSALAGAGAPGLGPAGASVLATPVAAGGASGSGDTGASRATAVDPSWADYAEPGLLLLNAGVDGAARFVDASSVSPWTELAISRALVPADLDGDGDLDLVIANLDQAPQVLRNLTIDADQHDGDGSDGSTDSGDVGGIDTGDSGNGPAATNWLQVRAFDPRLRREAIGARITVHAPGGPRLAHVLPPGSYLAAAEATAHLGLGAADAVSGFDVVWPDGLAESFDGVAANRVVELVRGQGRATP